ncbi:hypothetical protein RY27_24210 [Litorilinea aerophila]|nr:hypothetical protein RY27_24210 [Litorilinea aerophila]
MFAGFRSPAVLVMDAVLVKRPLAVGRTWMITSPLLKAATGPSSQIRFRPSTRLGGGSAETNSISSGRASTRVASGASKPDQLK